MTPVEILKAARAKIEQGWTRKVNARDRNGFELEPGDPKAVCWCAQGALWSTMPPNPNRHQAESLFEAAVGTETTRWNDACGRNKAEVLSAFDRAIALAESEGK